MEDAPLSQCRGWVSRPWLNNVKLLGGETPPLQLSCYL
jgi:hypothetical protein